MPKNNKLIGSLGERIAGHFLTGIGNTIICNNYKCKSGEIDIISSDEDSLVFTEVKTRNNTGYGYPFESVTQSKIRKIKKTAGYFLLSEGHLHKNQFNLRIEIISIIISDELAAAVLMENRCRLIDISSLISGKDFELEHITDI